MHHLLGFVFDNLNYDFKWLKMKCLWSTLCFLRDFGQNEEVKIGHLQLNRAQNESLSNLKNKTIFPISSLSWFQKCQNFWKKLIFWKKLPQKTSTGSLAIRFFLLKKLHLIDVSLGTSLRKILRFVSKMENLTTQNWVSCCDLSRMSRQDLFRILTELYLVNT